MKFAVLADGRRVWTPLRMITISVFLIPAVALVWILIVSTMVLVPLQVAVRHVDAVVSLAPGHQRLPAAVEYQEAGLADNLVISWFPGSISSAAIEPEFGWLENQKCRATNESSVHCLTPELNSTYGEALAVGSLAVAKGWDSILIVTSRYHVFRTRYIFERTLPSHIGVEVVAAPTELSIKSWVRHIGYENVAFVKALLQTWKNGRVPLSQGHAKR